MTDALIFMLRNVNLDRVNDELSMPGLNRRVQVSVLERPPGSLCGREIRNQQSWTISWPTFEPWKSSKPEVAMP